MTTRDTRSRLILFLTVAPLVAVLATPPARGEAIVLRSGLLLERLTTRRGRRIQHDAVEAALVRAGSYRPSAGQQMMADDGSTREWKPVELDENGAIQHRGLRGGYLHVPIESTSRRVQVLVAAGQSLTYFNGEIRGGDVYNYGHSRFPVVVREGTNDLLLQVSRGRARARLIDPPAAVSLSRADMTLPDLVAGEPTDSWAAVIVVNATEAAVDGLSVEARSDGLSETRTELPAVPPLSMRKVGFRLRGEAPSATGTADVTLDLRRGGETVHTISFGLRIRDPLAAHKRTFVSEIDGSVQYYGLRRAKRLSPDAPAPAIVLSCHGASVEAIGQAAAYSPKSWAHLVAPTNRRPYGFDWEDFGRADAMEVLGVAKRTLAHDPSRIYLTGHSMGGHGAWHLAVTHPDSFAAVGPSAGWLSYWSYGRSRDNRPEPRTPIEALLRRTTNTSDTIGLAANLKRMGVSILHGAEDDNVPAAQARMMAEVLEEFHHDWDLHEEPGKKHWWGNDLNDGGTACVDWPDMFDMFARHALPPPSSVRRVEFVTANPGVSSACHWVGIEAQIRQLDLSRVDIRTWPNTRRFAGTTENVAVLRLDVAHMLSPGPIAVELDGQKVGDLPFPEKDRALWLRRAAEEWKAIERPSPRQKGPHRHGPIKNELRHRVVFVHGTAGSDEENAWSFAKARFDAETFWYRGNASVDIVRDVDFEPARFPDRTVVLYGNADTNAAWAKLLGGSPIQVRRGAVTVGERPFEGDDLTAIFLRPRADSDVASVAVVAGSGITGMRAADRDSFFYPFIRYPDCLVRRAEGLETGRPSIIAAGYFGIDWSIESGEFAWAEAPDR